MLRGTGVNSGYKQASLLCFMEAASFCVSRRRKGELLEEIKLK